MRVETYFTPEEIYFLNSRVFPSTMCTIMALIFIRPRQNLGMGQVGAINTTAPSIDTHVFIRIKDVFLSTEKVVVLVSCNS
jgi:hypothetical protein